MRNRVLIVGPPKSGKLQILKGLSGNLPTISESTHSALSHEFTIKNKYFSFKLNVWIDEYGVGSDSQSGAGNDNDIPKDLIKAQEWISQFCSKEAQEVRDVLGAVIFTLDSNSQSKKEDLDCLIQFIDKLDNELWDGSGLVVSRRDISEELKDYLFDQGLEFIYLGHEENDDDKNKKNEFGEKQGIERIREVLEMVPWDNSQQEVNNEEEVLEKQCRNNSNEKEHETRQIVNSLFLSQGYEKPIFSQGAFGTNTSEEEQVDALETFMDKLKSIKDNGGSLNHEERTKLSEDLAEELLRLL